MFIELYAVAKHTPLQISVSPDGARLNVLIIPKPGDDADKGSALTKPIQAIGTPEELDRELPAKLAEYCAAINDLRLKIDMPIEAITAEAGKGGAKKKANAPAARKPAPAATPRPVKKAAPKPVKAARPATPVKPVKTSKPAEKKAAAARKPMPDTKDDSSRTGDSTPSVVTSGNERPSGSVPLKSSAPAAAPNVQPAEKSKRATREECLADLRTYLAECESTSIAITRALFLGHNTTGRSYERKFKSWDEFLADGRKAPDEWENKFPGPGDELQKAGGDAPPAKAAASRTVIDPSMKWPFPGSHEAAPAAKHISRVIYLRKEGHDDKMLGTSAVPLAIGDPYHHIQLGDLRVLDVEKRINGDERITVVAPGFDPLSNLSPLAKPHLKLTADGPAPAGDATEMPK